MAYKWAKYSVVTAEGDFSLSPTSGSYISADSSLDGYGSYNFTNGKYKGVLTASISAFSPTATVFTISNDGTLITKHVGKDITHSIPPRINIYSFTKGVKNICGVFIEFVTAENADAYPQNNVQGGYWYVYMGEEKISAYVNIDGNAKKVKAIYLNVNGESKKAVNVYCNTGGNT